MWCTAALFLTPSLAGADPVRGIEVLAPGPADSFGIVLRVVNHDAGTIRFATFDSSGTESTGDCGSCGPLTFGGSFNHVNGTAGTATLASTAELSWSYEFSNFGNSQFFQFNWDPDIESDPSYGAKVGEQLGLRIRIGTSAGEFSGVLGPGGPNGGLRALIASTSPTPVPEPGTLLLFGTAAAAGAVRTWRRRRA